MYAIVQHLARPFMLGMLTCGCVLFIAWRRTPRPRRGWKRVWLVYFAIYLWCLPAVAWWSSWQFERIFPPVVTRPAEVDAIVVLGGGVNPVPPAGFPNELPSDSLKRTLKAAELYHQGPPLPILLTGGNASVHGQSPSCAALMARQLEALGVPREQIILEERSLNTDQNAEFSAELLRTRGLGKVAMVTTATHLWRADHLFRKHGVDVVPVGCDYVTLQGEWGYFAFLPASAAAAQNQAVFHECLGTSLLWLRGKW